MTHNYKKPLTTRFINSNLKATATQSKYSINALELKVHAASSNQTICNTIGQYKVVCGAVTNKVEKRCSGKKRFNPYSYH